MTKRMCYRLVSGPQLNKQQLTIAKDQIAISCLFS